MRLSTDGIHPPRRHGATEDGHGDEFVSRAHLCDLEVLETGERSATRACRGKASRPPEPADDGRVRGRRLGVPRLGEGPPGESGPSDEPGNLTSAVVVDVNGRCHTALRLRLRACLRGEVLTHSAGRQCEEQH